MKEWKSGCKRCGRPLVNYSDRSYIYSLQFGFSRPEYCPECQKEEVRSRDDLGSPYFSITVGDQTETDITFGELNHPGRNHQLIETEGAFDETRFGLTPSKIKELADWFRNQQHRVAIVVGPTGSGKSTALPYWMLNPPEGIGVETDFFTREGQIVHTQPRIMAAEGQAEYVGQVLMGGHVGAGYDIGLQYSQHNESDWRNALVPKTDGIFINEIIQGKIGKYGYVIIDEAHERSLNIDKILFLLKERLSVYPKLKIIIASATINANAFRDFFGEDIAGIIEFEGKARVDKNHNPVSYEVFYRGDLEEEKILPYDNLQKLGRTIVDASVNKALWLVHEIRSGKKNNGDILVFLQGVKPIDEAVQKMKTFLERDELTSLVEVYPLYRDLPGKEKEKITQHDLDDGKTWIIFSTNIAEASVTIDSLGYEIETGVENQSVFDSSTKTTIVPLNLISKANCKQRWGRTGRTRNGEVYCMYTRSQFESNFLEYPVSAIKRSSMEELVLDLKAAGVSNPTVGWLENPDIEEIKRSTEALIKIGALQPQGNLSNKGLLLRNFAYSSSLVEALLFADELGCLVEMASILPVIKNGGFKKILNWNHNWEQYTKYQAFQVHQALMSGSQDDIDFIAKIIQCWDDQLSDETRQKWAEENFINIETLENIFIERNNLLDYFYQKSGEEPRKINITLLPKIRSILSYVFPEIIGFVQSDHYQYDQVSKPQDYSQINCHCLSTLPLNINWMDVNKYPKEQKESLYLRLMLDQLYPLNSVLSLTKTPEDKWQVNNSVYGSINITINSSKDQDFKLVQSLEVKIVGYSFQEEPRLIVDVVSFPEPFDLFVEKYKVGDLVTVEVKEILRYPNDQNPVLITQEIFSHSLILIEANQLTFSNASSVINQIPLGTSLSVQVEQINSEKRWIFVSMYQTTENLFNEKFVDKDKYHNEKKQIVIARVIKIETSNVQFILDWSNPTIGLLAVITVFSDDLPKKPEDYTIGEEVLVSVYRGKKITGVTYSKIPEQLKPKFEDNKKLFGLMYNNGSLEFEKRMGFSTKEALLNYESDPEFQQAIKKIYWLSNRLFVSSFLDISWFKEVNNSFPLSSNVIGIVQEIIPNSGLVVFINGIYRSFLPRSLLLNQFRNDPAYWFRIGEEIHCQITEIQYDQKQFILKQVFFEKPKLTPTTSVLISKPDAVEPIQVVIETLPINDQTPPVIHQQIPAVVSNTTTPEPTKSGWGKFKNWLNNLTK